MATHNVDIKVEVDQSSITQAAASGDNASRQALRQGVEANKMLSKQIIDTAGKMKLLDGKLSGLLTMLTSGGTGSLLGGIGIVVAGMTTLGKAVENLQEQMVKSANAIESLRWNAMQAGLSQTAKKAREGMLASPQLEGAKIGRSQAEERLDYLLNIRNEAIAAGIFGEGDKTKATLNKLIPALPSDLAKQAMEAGASDIGDMLEKATKYIDDEIVKIQKIYDQHNAVLEAHQKHLEDIAEAEHKEGQLQLARETEFSKQLQDEEESTISKIVENAKEMFKTQIEDLFDKIEHNAEVASIKEREDKEYLNFQSTLPPDIQKRIDDQISENAKSYSSILPGMTSLSRKGIYMGETTTAQIYDPTLIVVKNIYTTTQQIAQGLR